MNNRLTSIFSDVSVSTPERQHALNPDGFFRSQFLRSFEQLQNGHIQLHDPLGKFHFGDADSELRCQITMRQLATYRKIALGGSNGSAQAYIDGLWSCDDPTALMRIMIRNRTLLDSLEGGFTKLVQRLLQAWHARNHNSVQGSRKNIAAHYDLGNDFFRLFLDQRMMYSSALYAAGDDLNSASERKLDRICQTLELSADDHVLEIGSGWGGFACYAAATCGCRVTTITISQEQFTEAIAEVGRQGLQALVEVKLQDYRELDQQYDKVVSIEMIEAVGHHYLDQYFQVISDSLKPHGKALLQSIVIDDARYQQALREVDFIKRYIFPGSFIPCYSVITASAGQQGLMLEDLHDMGLSYAQTLRDWRRNYYAANAKVNEQGFDPAFQRMWEFYLCYCEAGFEERAISVGQLLFRKQP
ncbi:MAG: class I SAM-dependent methyltransferase [Gammaproteobacteria bacterium]|nr:class I SAM-dependent methyltransferase [Gammaproteobacteria bacterium]